MITIKNAELQDLNSIVAIEQHIFNTDSYPAFVVRQLFDISGHYFIVAKEKDRVLGYVIGGLNISDKKAWVLSLGVHPSGRGKGLGKQLLEKLITLFKTQNCEQIALTVYPDNMTAISIYEALGFVSGEVLNNYFLDNETRVIMTLQIN